MTTFPITQPATPGFRDVEFFLERVTGVTRSPFSLREQVYQHPGAAWRGSVSLPPMKEATAAPWAAFLRQLAGRFGSFTTAPPDRKKPRGTQSANFSVNGSHAVRATSLVVSGMTASATLLKGDRISIAQRLHEVVEDATADGSGNATLTIEPGLRDALVGGETVKCDPPEVRLRLTEDNVGLSRDVAGFYHLSFAFVEAL